MQKISRPLSKVIINSSRNIKTRFHQAFVCFFISFYLISTEAKFENIETIVKAICLRHYYAGCTAVFMGRLVGKE
jgi:hypothetical protein